MGSIVPALCNDQVIDIDGKSNRRTTSEAAAAPLHLLSAFAANVGLVLGQTATAEKSNEITAIPELLQVLDIEGSNRGGSVIANHLSQTLPQTTP